MNIKIFEFNPVSELTYILYDETNECVIVDPGCYYPEEEQELSSFIKGNNLTVKHIINTHLHFDHVFGVNYVTEKYNQPLQACMEDKILLDNYKTQLGMFRFPDDGKPTPQIGIYLKEGDQIHFGNQTLDVLFVPGHSPGSIVFYNKEAGVAIVGDVLFKGSVGRTDLIGGNHTQLISGIKDKLLTLPDNTIIYPGHGPSTTIGEEKRFNSYLQ